MLDLVRASRVNGRPMYWSKVLIPTLKESPSEAEIVSHKLLLRAGLVRKLTGGLYTFLPLGVKVLRKVETIIREEMIRAGAMEVFMPALQPPEIWQKSGRYEAAKDVLFKVNDRAKKEWVLGPTHEEVITSVVAGEISSYKQLPKNFFQIQTKFRDEIRPRFGLMRAKEFIMKDAYSFDSDDDGANASYRSMYDAYVRIFKRCGLVALPVEADTGVMGGSFSHEFMVPAETGEDFMVYCESSGYAANLEKATSQLDPESTGPDDYEEELAIEEFETPGVKTIEDLNRDPYNVPSTHQIKTLVFIADSKPVILLLRGDHQLNEAKTATAIGTGEFRPAEPHEIRDLLGASPGSLGAVGIKDVPVYVDAILQGSKGMVTGANKDGFHIRNVSLERDIHSTQCVDLRNVEEGEPCPKSGEPLKIRRSIEVGHVFKLGTKYSEKLGAQFLDANGKSQPAIMGCYGIGVTRTLQAVIEQSNDKFGICWPVSIAPFEVCITALDIHPDSEPMKIATSIYSELQGQGVDVILDDRDLRPGFKFKDSELVGFPLRLGIGEKGLAKGGVEFKPRDGELEIIPPDKVVEKTLEWLNERRMSLNPDIAGS